MNREDEVREIQIHLGRQIELFGSGHPETLATTARLANALGESGRLADAVPMFQRLLIDQTNYWGIEHFTTLRVRSCLIHWLKESRDVPREHSRAPKLISSTLGVTGYSALSWPTAIESPAPLIQTHSLRGSTSFEHSTTWIMSKMRASWRIRFSKTFAVPWTKSTPLPSTAGCHWLPYWENPADSMPLEIRHRSFGRIVSKPRRPIIPALSPLEQSWMTGPDLRPKTRLAMPLIRR